MINSYLWLFSLKKRSRIRLRISSSRNFREESILSSKKLLKMIRRGSFRIQCVNPASKLLLRMRSISQFMPYRTNLIWTSSNRWYLTTKLMTNCARHVLLKSWNTKFPLPFTLDCNYINSYYLTLYKIVRTRPLK